MIALLQFTFRDRCQVQRQLAVTPELPAPGAERQQIWRVAQQQVERVRDAVVHSLTGWLPPRPELEVVDAVVEAVPVAMVDRLVGAQRAAEQLRHDESVFE